MIFKNI